MRVDGERCLLRDCSEGGTYVLEPGREEYLVRRTEVEIGDHGEIRLGHGRQDHAVPAIVFRRLSVRRGFYSSVSALITDSPSRALARISSGDSRPSDVSAILPYMSAAP